MCGGACSSHLLYRLCVCLGMYVQGSVLLRALRAAKEFMLYVILSLLPSSFTLYSGNVQITVFQCVVGLCGSEFVLNLPFLLRPSHSPSASLLPLFYTFLVPFSLSLHLAPLLSLSIVFSNPRSSVHFHYIHLSTAQPTLSVSLPPTP